MQHQSFQKNYADMLCICCKETVLCLRVAFMDACTEEEKEPITMQSMFSFAGEILV